MRPTPDKIAEVLETTGGNKAAAARLLNIPASTLKDMIAKQEPTEAVKASLKVLIEKLGKCGPKSKRPVPDLAPSSRALEICLLDPHLGLTLNTGRHTWSLGECREVCLEVVEDLLSKAKAFGPYEQIVWPFGNDFLHIDTAAGTTTKGTPQVDAAPWHEVLAEGYELAIEIAQRLRRRAPHLRIIQVAGNHDRVLGFALGHVLAAYFARTDGVIVTVDPSPYQFWSYGANLVGYNHGRYIHPLRLAAIMANECHSRWSKAKYRAWHLGDQHRRGATKPLMLAEQGVEVEFLAGLTPANEWHKLYGLDHQSRGATAFVWDHDTGPLAKLYSNLDPDSGLVAVPRKKVSGGCPVSGG